MLLVVSSSTSSLLTQKICFYSIGNLMSPLLARLPSKPAWCDTLELMIQLILPILPSASLAISKLSISTSWPYWPWCILKDDALSVALSHGMIVVVTTASDQRTRLETNQDYYSDGKWHCISVTKSSTRWARVSSGRMTLDRMSCGNLPGEEHSNVTEWDLLDDKPWPHL